MIPSETSAVCGNIASRTGTLRIGETSSGFRGRIAAILARDSWSQYEDTILMNMLKARYLTEPRRLAQLGSAYGFWAPWNAGECWADHFERAGQTTMQGLISAGHTIAALPSYIAGGAGSIEYTIDYGTIFGENTLTLTWTALEYGNKCTIKPTISVSADGVTFTAYPSQSQIFATGFRYAKIKLEVTAPDVTSIIKITALRLLLKTKKQTETIVGSITDTVGGGTAFTLTKLYASISTVQITISDAAGGFAISTGFTGANPTTFTGIAWDKSGTRAARAITAYVEGIARTS